MTALDGLVGVGGGAGRFLLLLEGAARERLKVEREGVGGSSYDSFRSQGRPERQHCAQQCMRPFSIRRTSWISTGFSFLPTLRLELYGLMFSLLGLQSGTSVRSTRLAGVGARGGVATADERAVVVEREGRQPRLSKPSRRLLWSGKPHPSTA